MTGTVKTLLKDKRCGFILGEDGKDYFFHETGLKNVTYSDLEKGREVSFEDSEGQKGLRAEDIFV